MFWKLGWKKMKAILSFLGTRQSVSFPPFIQQSKHIAPRCASNFQGLCVAKLQSENNGAIISKFAAIPFLKAFPQAKTKLKSSYKLGSKWKVFVTWNNGNSQSCKAETKSHQKHQILSYQKESNYTSQHTFTKNSHPILWAVFFYPKPLVFFRCGNSW